MAWNEATRAKYRRTGGHGQNNLTDEEWSLIEPMIPKQDRMCRPRKTDPREFFDAIRYIPASSFPSCFPPFFYDSEPFNMRGFVVESCAALCGMVRETCGCHHRQPEREDHG